MKIYKNTLLKLIKNTSIHYIIMLSLITFLSINYNFRNEDIKECGDTYLFCHDKNFKTFREIFKNNDQNVSDKWDNYFEIYDNAYHNYVGKKSNVLEIGVQNGGSLQNANKYFVNANIYGIDINPDVCKLELGPNIKTYCFDAKDSNKIELYFKDINFDVIADDGSHINSDIIDNFKILFKKLSPNGVYLIEDLHTAYWDGYGGGYLKKTTAIEFLKSFVDLLNSYHIREKNFIDNLSADEKYIFEWLESVSFYDSVAVIKKLKYPRKKPYKRVRLGKKAPIF